LLSDANISEKIGAGTLNGLATRYLYTPAGELVGIQPGGITRDILEAFISKHESRINSSPDAPDKNSE